jgi:ABC-type multidrug transport system fused ATPase/permease subunit
VKRRAFGKMLSLLSPTERRRGALVLALMLALAFLETAGVASVMPFHAVLGNPKMVANHRVLSALYERGGFKSMDAFLFALGVTAFVMVIISAAVRVLTTYASNRYIQMRRYTISARLLGLYLRQPYEFFLNRNSADLSKTILSEVDDAVNHAIKPAMEAISYGLILTVLVALHMAVDPKHAKGVTVTVGIIYGFTYLATRRGLGRLGIDRVKANRQRFTAASEVFGGIKDLKVLGREEAYLSRYREPAARYAAYQAKASTLQATPKYFIEAVAFGGLILLALTLMATRHDLGRTLPLLGLYAFAGFRLLPAAQHIYAGVSSLRFGFPAIDALYDDMEVTKARSVPRLSGGVALKLTTRIKFDRVRFTYPGAERSALSDLDLTIDARTTVGFVGRTGAGKTTLGDLILGLLHPSEGSIMVDDTPLSTETIHRWQRSIGYVPQTIYLADTSVTENIAFGLDRSHINFAAVERAAKIAHIHEFVVEQLPRGYETEIGERGVRLSGGQRQRIGIARALYHDPDLLVLDEATSALDTTTERAIMDAIRELSGRKTIVIIAHRMTTVKHCNQIVVLEKGRLCAVGTFDELATSSEVFRKLAVA